MSPENDTMTDQHAKARAHEEQVVGSVILDPSVLDDVAEVVTVDDFRTPSLAILFGAVCRLAEASRPIDLLTVADEVQREGLLAQVGGLAVIQEVKGKIATSGSAVWHADRVREYAYLRAVEQAGRELITEGVKPEATEASALSVVDTARARLDALVTRDRADVPNEQAVWDAIAALDEPTGLATPWVAVTRATSGWQSRKLYVFAARPGGGKSIMAVQAALDMARRGKTALLFSMEMDRTELYHRMLSATATVDASLIQARKLRDRDRDRLHEAAKGIAAVGDRLVVDDRAGLSLAQIRARVRAVKRRREVGLVVVDYLGLVRPADARQDRRVQVDQIAQGLKELAMDLEVPVLVTAQLRRIAPDMSGRVRPPVVSDLRESGGIEQAADFVFLLHREADESQEDGLSQYLRLIMAKARSASLGMVELLWEGEFSRVSDAPCDAVQV